MCFWFARRMHRKARVYGASSSGTARCFLVQRHCAREVLSVRNIPQFVTCISRRTECGHEPCAESVSIAPTEMHLSIRTAANPARRSETEIERDPLSPVLAGRAPQSRPAGGAAIFPRVVSWRSFLLWPCRSGLASDGGSQPLPPGSGAWLFPDRHCGSIDMSQRRRPTLYRPEPIRHFPRGSGGWGGIRTHGALARTPVFKTGALNRSATHPGTEVNSLAVCRLQRATKRDGDSKMSKDSNGTKTHTPVTGAYLFHPAIVHPAIVLHPPW